MTDWERVDKADCAWCQDYGDGLDPEPCPKHRAATVMVDDPPATDEEMEAFAAEEREARKADDIKPRWLPGEWPAMRDN